MKCHKCDNKAADYHHHLFWCEECDYTFVQELMKNKEVKDTE